MTKIKQARAWLTRKERTSDSSSEKKGDITLQNIIWIAVAVILIGLVVGILIVVINSQGDEIAENASGVTNQDPAIYDANCNGRDVGRVGGMGTAATSITTAGNAGLDVAYDANAGYGHGELAIDNATGTTVAADNGVLDIDVAASTTITAAQLRVGVLHAVSNVTEARFNADFNGNGIIDDGQVVAILGNNELSEGADSLAATPVGSVAPVPRAAVIGGTQDLNGLRVGSRLVVDSRNSCWGVRI